MFAWWGRTVYRYRFIVIGVMVALCLGGGIFGLSLGSHVTQSGFYDDNSQSAKASVLGDEVYGRDRTSHIVAIFTAPDGSTVDDPQWQKGIVDALNKVQADHPNQILGWVGWLKATNSTDLTVQKMHTSDMKRTFVSIPLKGNNDDEILTNYKAVQSDLQKLGGGKVELAGLQPVANELTGTIAKDQKRAEVLAVPLVAVVLFFVFGGVIAAGLPVIVGGLSIAGSLGILRLIAMFGPVHYFAQPVVTMIGLGIAIDYGLFVVSRFREETAEGYDTATAVRRTVMTAGRTVTFSAVIIVASAAGLLLFPQGFLKSLTYAVIAAVMLSAILSVTLLPACLGILGQNVDAFGVRTLLRVPFFRNWKPTNWWLNWLADRLQKTKTREEIENGFWGKLINRVMKRPILFAAPIIIAMILLIVPLGKLSLGGISEKYLPPTNPVRQAQEDFDRTFPGFRTNQLTLVIQNASPPQIDEIANKAAQLSGFTNTTWQPRPATDEGNHDPKVTVLQNGLVNSNNAAAKISDLRSIQPPKGVTLWVGGTPALEQDSIHSIFAHMPLMLVILICTTTILMFLAFGSLVLPIKAAVMSALTLGSTLGVLTWIFVDGHFAKWLNFTPTPLTAPVIGLIIAVIYGLSTDYEVFLVSRMVEARERGMSTAEAIRLGTAATGRIITAAALILVVVMGAFVFSDLVMMKYLAFGFIAALLLDATVVRMFLVPSVMKLLGDDCWWAPRWMKRLQNRIGMGEIHLPDERKRPTVREPEPALVGAGASMAPPPPHDPTHPAAESVARPGARRATPRRIPPPQEPSVAGTTRIPVRPRQAPAEPQTTRLSTAARNAARAVVNNATAITQRTYRPAAAPPPREEREIESWLGELRGDAPPAAPPVRPSADATRAMPEARRGDPDKTTAIPVQRVAKPGRDPESTEKLPSQGRKPDDDDQRQRAPRKRDVAEGGGVSAQDLLRREGRI
ncbi:MAG: MMPL family transporter [Mycobacteriaceae bacterium]|nr:MMPL family transporter [Mycobacteriaceae bacterium]MBV9638915.1 MMPL family transporter [Mycobacteriaceae bacterium]